MAVFYRNQQGYVYEWATKVLRIPSKIVVYWGEHSLTVWRQPEKTDTYTLTWMTQAYECLGRPLHQTPVILVGGTNGKGLTVAALYGLWQTLGFKVGLYSSPHLFHKSERVRVSSQDLPRDLLERTAVILASRLGEDLWQRLSEFERITLGAFWILHRAGVDLAVIEVGLGGRLDATNVVEPWVSVITSVDLDHREHLGDSLESIAQEKLGIARSGGFLVLGRGTQKPQLASFWSRVLPSYPNIAIVSQSGLCQLSTVPPRWLYSCSPLSARHDDSSRLCAPIMSSLWPTHLPRPPQSVIWAWELAQRASQAMAAQMDQKCHDHQNSVTILLDQTLRREPLDTARPKLSPTLRGRGELVRLGALGPPGSKAQDRYIYVDVAHNPAAIQVSLQNYLSLAQSVCGEHSSLVALICVLKDKNPSQMIYELAKVFDRIIFLAPSDYSRCYAPPGAVARRAYARGAMMTSLPWSWAREFQGSSQWWCRSSWQSAWELYREQLDQSSSIPSLSQSSPPVSSSARSWASAYSSSTLSHHASSRFLGEQSRGPAPVAPNPVVGYVGGCFYAARRVLEHLEVHLNNSLQRDESC